MLQQQNVKIKYNKETEKLKLILLLGIILYEKWNNFYQYRPN